MKTRSSVITVLFTLLAAVSIAAEVKSVRVQKLIAVLDIEVEKGLGQNLKKTLTNTLMYSSMEAQARSGKRRFF